MQRLVTAAGPLSLFLSLVCLCLLLFNLARGNLPLLPPLHKNGSITNPSNFRPISVLVTSADGEFPTSNMYINRYINIYHPTGFYLPTNNASEILRGHFTTTCCIDVSEFILRSMDQVRLTLASFRIRLD